jgi:hypothetical protein
LVTVIDIEAAQYAKMEMGGLFVIFARPRWWWALDLVLFVLPRKESRCVGDARPLKLRISISGILIA